ncbi:hypothetical protein [Prevotella sp.]|uniref:hypothetical protein n=1 Tax=uncultured Prevotella sp. TaxID=159272 RepID=UPI0027E26107|nr:hypothetical protein [uncultured Prevotella sp.]MCI6130083.1 hypothetical protein [Prevotella sp.]
MDGEVSINVSDHACFGSFEYHVSSDERLAFGVKDCTTDVAVGTVDFCRSTFVYGDCDYAAFDGVSHRGAVKNGFERIGNGCFFDIACDAISLHLIVDVGEFVA